LDAYKPLIEPVLRDEALLEDIAAANLGDGQFRLWWLGQSGFLLQWNGRHLLLDPYLSDSLTRKYAGTPTPHIRMTALPVAFAPRYRPMREITHFPRLHQAFIT
jgi:hypothetical protein